MHVSEYKDGVIGLVTCLEHLEINPFRNFSLLGQLDVVPRKNTVIRNFISGRDGNEDIAVFLR